MHKVSQKFLSVLLSSLMVANSFQGVFAQSLPNFRSFKMNESEQDKYMRTKVIDLDQANPYNDVKAVSESTRIYNPMMEMERVNSANHQATESFVKIIETYTAKAEKALKEDDAEGFTEAVDQINDLSLYALSSKYPLAREEALALLVSNIANGIISEADKKIVYDKAYAYLAEHKNDYQTSTVYHAAVDHFAKKNNERASYDAMMAMAMILSGLYKKDSKLKTFYDKNPIYFTTPGDYPVLGKPSKVYTYPGIKDAQLKYLVHLLSSLGPTDVMDIVFATLPQEAFEEYIKSLLIRRVNDKTSPRRINNIYDIDGYENDVYIMNKLTQYGPVGEKLTFHFINNQYTRASWIWANINGAYMPSVPSGSYNDKVIKANLYKIYCYDLPRLSDPQADLDIKQHIALAYHKGNKDSLYATSNECKVIYPMYVNRDKVIKKWENIIATEIIITVALVGVGNAIRPAAAYISACARASKARVITLYRAGQSAMKMKTGLRAGLSAGGKGTSHLLAPRAALPARAAAAVGTPSANAGAAEVANTTLKGVQGAAVAPVPPVAPVPAVAAGREAAAVSSRNAASTASTLKTPTPAAAPKAKFEVPMKGGKVNEGEIIRRMNSPKEADIAWRRSFSDNKGRIANGRDYAYYKKIADSHQGKAIAATEEAALFGPQPNPSYSITGEMQVKLVDTRGAVTSNVARTPEVFLAKSRYVPPAKITSHSEYMGFYKTLDRKERELMSAFHKATPEAWNGVQPHMKEVLTVISKDPKARIKFFQRLEELAPQGQVARAKTLAERQARIDIIESSIEADKLAIKKLKETQADFRLIAKAETDGAKRAAYNLDVKKVGEEANAIQKGIIVKEREIQEITQGYVTKVEYHGVLPTSTNVDFRNLRFVDEITKMDKFEVERLMATMTSREKVGLVSSNGELILGTVNNASANAAKGYSALLGCTPKKPCHYLFTKDGGVNIFSPDRQRYVRVTAHEYGKGHIHLYDISNPSYHKNYTIQVLLQGQTPGISVRKRIMVDNVISGKAGKDVFVKLPDAASF